MSERLASACYDVSILAASHQLHQCATCAHIRTFKSPHCDAGRGKITAKTGLLPDTINQAKSVRDLYDKAGGTSGAAVPPHRNPGLRPAPCLPAGSCACPCKDHTSWA